MSLVLISSCFAAVLQLFDALWPLSSQPVSICLGVCLLVVIFCFVLFSDSESCRSLSYKFPNNLMDHAGWCSALQLVSFTLSFRMLFFCMIWVFIVSYLLCLDGIWFSFFPLHYFYWLYCLHYTPYLTVICWGRLDKSCCCCYALSLLVRKHS